MWNCVYTNPNFHKNYTGKYTGNYTVFLHWNVVFLCKLHWSVVFCVKFYWLANDTHFLFLRLWTGKIAPAHLRNRSVDFFCLDWKHDFSEICALAWWLAHSFLRISPWKLVRLTSNKNWHKHNWIENVIVYFIEKVYMKTFETKKLKWNYKNM